MLQKTFSEDIQEVNINCTFHTILTYNGNLYGCDVKLESGILGGSLMKFKFNGEHEDEKGESHVHVFKAENISMPIIPYGIKVHFKNVQTIIIKNCSLLEIKRDTIKAFGYLQVLILGYNKIETLEPKLFDDLSISNCLDLSHNQIQNLSEDIFASFVLLKTLYLNHNLLRELNKNIFMRMTSLEKLKLNNNQIKSINENLFAKTTNLIRLDISENLVNSFGEKTFQKLIRIERLSLQGNPLNDTNIWKDFINLKGLTELRLTEDPWTASEGLLQKISKYVSELSLTNCQSKDETSKYSVEAKNVSISTNNYDETMIQIKQHFVYILVTIGLIGYLICVLQCCVIKNISKNLKSEVEKKDKINLSINKKQVTEYEVPIQSTVPDYIEMKCDHYEEIEVPGWLILKNISALSLMIDSFILFCSI